VYPELQSGRMFWFSTFEIGPRVMLTLPLRWKALNISMSNNLCGWTSRPDPATETTFYHRQFSDFINSVHRNLRFGFIDLFDHTEIFISAPNLKERGPSLGYRFKYFGYDQQPKVMFVMHSFNLRWQLGKKK
jgi:hypothetical protein